jgi:SAM-dependent methyltransferase
VPTQKSGASAVLETAVRPVAANVARDHARAVAERAEPDLHAGGREPTTGWRAYDSVVEVYERAAVPMFAPLARDLVAAVAPRADAVVVDVGTGSGLVARIVGEWLGARGTVIGVDPSVPMLEAARAVRLKPVAAAVPGLPFRSESVDVALANLVLSHVTDYEAALADIARVLRQGGRFGCSAWGPGDPPIDGDHGAVAERVVDEVLAARGANLTPPVPAVPWEDHFRVRENLDRALRHAGFGPVELGVRTYRWTRSIDEYLSARDWRPRSRYLRATIGDDLWYETRTRAAHELARRLGEAITTAGRVWIAVSTRR